MKCQLYQYNSDDYSFIVNSEAFFAETLKVDELDKGKTHWLNYHSLEDKLSIEKLCENFGFDKLISEDLYTTKLRPKLEEYENYMFFSIKSAVPSEQSDRMLEKEQISFMLGKNYLISIQEKKSDHFSEVRERIEAKKGKIRDTGPDFLLFRMLDAIIDNYFHVIEKITEENRRLELMITRRSDTHTLRMVELQKRKLLSMRKIVVPLKEITLQLEKVDTPFIGKKNRHYFTDLKESCSSVIDDIDSNAGILEGMINLYYAVQGQRMNEIMKLLTIVSTIFIPLTFIAGIYGMNFANMPELQAEYGYFIALMGMVFIAVLLIFYFIRKGWLGRRNK